MRPIWLAAVLSMISVAALADEGHKKSAPRRIEIALTESGFEPKKINAKKGEEVTLAFTRTTDKTCAKEVIVEVSASEKVEKKLPLGEAVPITVTFNKTGTVRFACAMDMVRGVVVVQ